MHQAASDLGLAWPVLWAAGGAKKRSKEKTLAGLEGVTRVLRYHTAVIVQHPADGTLETLLEEQPFQGLIAAFREFVRALRAQPFAHNDLQPSNVAYRVLKCGSVDLRLIDCARALIPSYLEGRGLSRFYAEQVVASGRRADAVGLQADLGRISLGGTSRALLASKLYCVMGEEQLWGCARGAPSDASVRQLEMTHRGLFEDVQNGLRRRLPPARLPAKSGDTQEEDA